MNKFINKYSFAILALLLTGCGAQPVPQGSSVPQAGKTSPAPASKVADVKTPDAVAQPPAQPAIPQQIPPPQVLPQQAVPTCNKSVGTGVAVGGILQTIGGFVSGDYLKGTGGIINTIAGSQMNKNC